MSIVNESRSSAMTSEASHLLDYFVSGLDEVVYEIAETIAESRGNIDSKSGTIEITHDDVRAAAESVLEAIRDQTGKAIPEAAAKQIEEMHHCVLEKCKIK